MFSSFWYHTRCRLFDMQAIALSMADGKHCSFGAVSLTVSHNHNSGEHQWPKRAFYFHGGEWCLWGRGPEPDQGTSLSGTVHPFHTANTSTVMNLVGGNQLNEFKTHVTVEERKWGERCWGKKNMKRKMGIVGLLVNKPTVTNKGLSGEAWRVLGVCLCVIAGHVTPGSPAWL